jgi:hypothetical protein
MAKRVFEQPNDPRLAALICLSRALDDLSLPIRLAKDWIRPADLPGFIEEIEKRVRALAGFLDTYLEEHRAAFEEADRETAFILKTELDSVRKNLDFLDKLGAAWSRAVADIPPVEPAVTDFSSETEELRKLRAGELKIEPLSDLKGPRP